MAFTVYVVKDYNEMSEKGFETVKKNIDSINKPYFNLILPTGSSPIGLYNHLINSDIDPGLISSWNLDEYLGSTEYHDFMQKNLFDHFPIQNPSIPPGDMISPVKLEEALKNDQNSYWIGDEGEFSGKLLALNDSKHPYIANIRDNIIFPYVESMSTAGGIDMAIVGTGQNGHIGFHECGIPFDSYKMGIIKLCQNTIENAVEDSSHTYETVPRYAITLTAAGVLGSSKSVLLLASGPRKTKAIADSLLYDVSEKCPISCLQDFAKNNEVTYIIDNAAANGILGKKEKQIISGKGISIII
jgi:glucosamine-6-phosphate deaminase